MAKRDHSLEDGIVQAAYSEFLTYGFQKASLHKIADKAGVTTGAIYTRYKSKDALFASLLQDFFDPLIWHAFCRKVHPARGLTHFYRNTLVDFATNLVALVYCVSLSFLRFGEVSDNHRLNNLEVFL